MRARHFFDALYPHKQEIDAAFGEKLSWQRIDKRRACRIACVMENGGYKSDESKWPEIQEKMIDAMIRLEKALTPFMMGLVQINGGN